MVRAAETSFGDLIQDWIKGGNGGFNVNIHLVNELIVNMASFNIENIYNIVIK